jgi:hypothetical protein
MGNKRRRDETEEERKERKKLKKESKKSKTEKHTKDKSEPTTVEEPNASASAVVTSTSKKSNSPRTSESSCQRKTIRMIFSLYPCDLEDIVIAIKRSLRLNLLKFVAGMDGVLLAFDNVKIVPNGGKTAGVIMNEQPYLHYLADLDILVFGPSPGMRLQGTVTECFESHVSLLVHNFFNASITSDHLVTTGFSYDVDRGEWVHEDDGSTAIAAEEAVDFTVEQIHECAGTISMEGKNPTVMYGVE